MTVPQGVLDRLFALTDAHAAGDVSRDVWLNALDRLHGEIAELAVSLRELEPPAALFARPDVADVWSGFSDGLDELDRAMRGLREGSSDRVEAAVERVRQTAARMAGLSQDAAAHLQRALDDEDIVLEPPPPVVETVIFNFHFECKSCGQGFDHEEEGEPGAPALDVDGVTCPHCGWRPADA